MELFWPFSYPAIAMIGAFVYMIVRAMGKSRIRELEVRERIAMIERGLVPPPEKDPNGFDRAMYISQRTRDREARRSRRRPSTFRSAGIMLMGVGLGMMVLITFAGDSPKTGLGVGGGLAIMGLSFLVNSLFHRRLDHDAYPPYRSAPPPSQEPPHTY